MPGKYWESQEYDILKENYQTKTCAEIAKMLGRTTRSVQHVFAQLGLERRKAQLGDVVKGWKIVNVYSVYNGSQYVTMADIESTICDKKRTVRLSILTNNQIARPDRPRPDVTLKNTTHGMSHTRLHSIWLGMRNRCSNRNNAYPDYGGRGISLCEDWNKFENFRDWALSHGYNEDLTLDRIDVDGNYCPENCRWATKLEQTVNKRNTDKTLATAFGETKTLIEWAHDDRCVASIGALQYRIRAGWDHEEAITTPPERKQKLNIANWLKLRYPAIYEEYQKS